MPWPWVAAIFRPTLMWRTAPRAAKQRKAGGDGRRLSSRLIKRSTKVMPRGARGYCLRWPRSLCRVLVIQITAW
ncbi:MAG TPA: hypothetical protein VJ783_17230 [Pirellulales bacterium]|nr:hypothetical protein [Pirellulales bacterium]